MEGFMKKNPEFTPQFTKKERTDKPGELFFVLR